MITRSYVTGILTVLSILCFVKLSFGKDYYVATGGNNSNQGSLSSPFLTINKAATVAKAGDTVLVRGGIYKERVLPRNSGGPGAYVTFQNYGSEEVTIDASNLGQGFILWGVSYIKIKGFTIIGSINSCIHIHDHKDIPDKGSDNNIIEHNIVHNCGTSGNNGIYIGGHGNTIRNNISYLNGYQGSDRRAHGIYVLGNSNVVEGNTIHSNARIGIRMEGKSNVIKGNMIHDNKEYGIGIWVDAPLEATDIFIHRNLILNNAKGGIRIWGEGSGGKPDTIYVYNNTIVSSTGEEGLVITGGSKNIKIKNNIMTGQFAKQIIWTDSQSVQGYEEDFNIFYGSGFLGYNSVLYNTFEQYRSASSWGMNSMTGDPQLKPDYTLSPGSIAIDKGTNVGMPFSGKAPDIGAFESTQPLAPPANLRLGLPLKENRGLEALSILQTA